MNRRGHNRVISLVLAFSLLLAMIPQAAIQSQAATLGYEPFAEINYSYSTSVSCGEIRYISQIKSSKYFNWSYWPSTNSGLAGYVSPGSECGTASVSMALSYIGINKTPYDLLTYKDGYTGYVMAQAYADTWGGTYKRYSGTSRLNELVQKYIDGNGKYSPIVIHLKYGESKESNDPGHFVVVAGKISEDTYLIVDPATSDHRSYKITNGQITYMGITQAVDRIDQYYNPQGSINSYLADECTFYPTALKLKIKEACNPYSLPCNSETAKKYGAVSTALTSQALKVGDTITVCGIYKNSEGNYWYKIDEDKYVFANRCEEQTECIKPWISGGSFPSNIKGTTNLQGVVTTGGSQLKSVQAVIYRGSSTSGTPILESKVKTFSAVTDTTYKLTNGSVDTTLPFGNVKNHGNGYYTLAIWAEYVYYYVQGGTVKTAKPKTEIIDSYYFYFGEQGCSHSYSYVVTYPTCTERGYTTYTCKTCGHSYIGNYKDADGHYYISEQISEANCMQDGEIRHTCMTCLYEYSDITPATGHAYGAWKTNQAATCEANGSEVRACVTCGKNEWRTVNAVGHNYEAIHFDASCGDPARTQYTCTVCGSYYTVYDEMGWSEWSASYPEGIDESLIESRMEYRYQDKETTSSTEPALAGWTLVDSTTQWGEYSAWSGWSDTAVTASDSTKVETRTVYGYYYYLCPSCGAHMHGWGTNACYTWAGGCGATIDRGSFYRVWSTVTWDQAGLKDWHGTGDYYAIIDGQRVFKYESGGSKTQYRSATRAQITVYNYYRWSDWSAWSATVQTATDTRNVETRMAYRYINNAEIAHTFGQWYVENAATCASSGNERRDCTVCGYYETREIPKTEHSYAGYAVTQEPTFFTQGTLTGTCQGCGGTEEIDLPELNKTHYAYSVVQEPTCSEYGVGCYTLEISGIGNFSFEVGIDLAEHSYTEAVTDPSCYEAGYTTYTCSCGDSYEDSYVDAIGHDWDEGTVTLEATETATGILTYTCAACGETKTEDIPMLEHTHSYGETVVAATCTTQGYTIYTCRCGHTYEDNYTNVIGHSYVNSYCEVCGVKDPNAGAVVTKSGSCGTNVTWSYYDNGTLVISGNGSMNNYTNYSSIPWYSLRSSITNVIVEEGILYIGESCFANLSAVTSMSLPETLEWIAEGAFWNCSSLTEITLPKGVYELENDVFYGCNALTAIHVDEENKQFSSDAAGVLFNKTKSLLMLAPFALEGGYTVPETVREISSEAFYNRAGLTHVVISEGTRVIGTSAFGSCAGLQSVQIPNTVETIGASAFANCTGLKELTLPDSVVSVGKKAFYNCSGLETVQLSKSMTEIAEETFRGCGKLKEIVLPKGMQILNNSAFRNCTALETISVPESLNVVDNYVFENCNNLTYTQYENAKYLGTAANAYDILVAAVDTAITACIIHPSTEIIGGGAFKNCAGLTEIVIPDSVRAIGSSGFAACVGLTEIHIPASVSYLGAYVFDECTGLKKVTLPSNLTSIPSSMFYDCKGLQEIVWPESLCTIGWYAFRNCESLTSIVLPDTVTELGQGAFYGCDNLAQIELSKGLKVTGLSAFDGCTALQEITIPASVTDIGGQSFYGCGALKTIVFEGSRPNIGTHLQGNVFYGVTATAYYPACDESWGTPVTTSGGTITWEKYVTEHGFGEWSEIQGATCAQAGTQTRACNCGETETRELALTAGGHSWDAGTVLQESSSYYGGTILFTCTECGDTVTLETKPGVTISASGVCGDSIAWYLTDANDLIVSGSGEMYDGNVIPQSLRDSVWSITVEEGITYVGESAFYYCQNTTSVSLPQSLIEIGNYGFGHCTKLAYVAFPKNLKRIGNWAFEDCHGLTSLSLPGSLETYTGAFQGCSYLQTVVLQQGITEVSSSAFNDCKALRSVVLPDSVTKIDYSAFEGCVSLREVALPAGLTFIGSEAFYGCGLREIYIPYAVTEIGHHAFAYCYWLSAASIPYGVTKLNNAVFVQTGLKEIRIPNSVISIDKYAFSQCSKLEKVILSGNVTEIYDQAFMSCPALTEAVYLNTEYHMKKNVTIGSFNEDLQAVLTYISEEQLAEAAAVSAVICEIGEVTQTSEEKICNARAAYDALGDDLKPLVDNYGVLVEAEAAWDALQLVDIEGTAMTLGDSLSVNFVINVSLLDGDGHYAVITKSYADGRADVTTSVPQDAWSLYAGNLRYFAFEGVSAKEMCDMLTVEVFASDGTAVSNVYTDSIHDYAMRMLTREDVLSNAELCAVYVDMLNYGAAAQKQFAYDTENLANAHLTEEQKAYATGACETETKLSASAGRAGTMLSLKNRITLDFILRDSVIGTDYTGMQAVVTYTDHYGNVVMLTLGEEAFKTYQSNYHYISVPGLAVADYGTLVTCVIYNSEGRVVARMTDSIEGYAHRMKGSLPEIVDAIIKFGVSSYNYFH